MVNEKRVLEEFLQLVKVDSVTLSEGKLAAILKEKLKALGAEVYVDDAGSKIGSDTGNIIGEIKGDKNKEPLLFAAHMDTVEPGTGIKPVIKNGLIYSEGETILAADDKAGIVAILEAIRTIKECKYEHGDIEIVFTIAEEGGLYGVKNLDFSKIKSKVGYVLDSDGSPGSIVVKGPAQDKIDVTVKGKSAHAGVCPEEGISAIQIASRAISMMKLLRIDKDTTANIGSIKGGYATNIVTDKVEIKAEARSTIEEKLNQQSQHMKDCFEKAAKEFGTSVDVEVERVYSAFNLTDKDKVVQIAKKAAEKLNFPVELAATGGGSDTNIFNAKGISAVNLGVGMKKPHTTDEHIAIKDLNDTARYIVEIIKQEI